jgi:iron complex transport system substrate-binding protein
MTAKLVAFALLIALAAAFVASGNVSKVVDKVRMPKSAATVRQIKVVSEDATHRRIKHALGEVDVPTAPQRIVSLSPAGTDSLLALGIKPVLATTSWKDENSASYLAKRLAGVPLLRQAGSVNLEEVLAAKPDLILASSRDARMYAQLSKIAPTVCFAADASPNRENKVLDVGEVIGKTKEARALLASYKHHVQEAKATLATHAAGQPVVFLRFRGHTCTIYTRSTMFGPLLFEQLGLTPDPTMPMAMISSGWDVLSVERLSILRAEHIFLVIDPDGELYFSRVADTPIWRDIPAVKHNHVHRVVSSTWLGGDGILGSEAIIDDVLAAIAPNGSSHAIP